MDQNFTKLSDLDIPWGDIKESKRFSIILEMKALLSKKGETEGAKNITEYLYAVGNGGTLEEFAAQLERLVLYLVVHERAERKRQVDYFVREVAKAQGMEPSGLGKSKPGILPFPELAPKGGNLENCSDQEIDAYLLMMSESLTDSPHYETVKDYFRKGANGELD